MKYHHLFGSWHSLMLLGCMAVLVSSTSQAQVIFDDSFTSGSPTLNGRTPDTADADGATWVDTELGTQFGGGIGTNTIAGGVDTYSLNDAYPMVLAYAGSNFVDGQTYTLSTDFTYTSGSGWIGIGFLDGTATTSSNDGTAFNNGVAWMINNGQGNDVNGFANTDGSGPFGGSVANGTAGLNSGIMEIQLAIGTGIDAGDGTATFLLGPDASDLTTIGTLSLSNTEVQAISGVGFYAYGYNGPGGTPSSPTGTIDNFILAAPEPNVYAMLVVGLGGLILVRRLSRSSRQI